MKKFLALAALFALVGCKDIEIKDGRVPAEYLAQAKAFEGSYHGRMDARPGTMQIIFDGDRPRMVWNNGADLVDPSCSSRIGDLLSVHVEGQQNPVITGATFRFDPGYCSIWMPAKTVEVSFANNRRFSVRVLWSSEWVERCHWEHEPVPRPPNKGMECHSELRQTWMSGLFQR